MDGSVIEDRACSSCGARNRPGTGYCWQCYAPFAAAASDPVRSDTGTSVIARATATFAKLDVPSAPTQRRAWRGVVPRVLMAAVAVAGWFVWQHVSGIQLPSSLAGVERMEGPVPDLIETQLEPARDAYEGDIAAAVYGSGTEPTYAVVIVEQVEEAGRRVSLNGLQGAAGPIPLDGLELTTEPGSDVACGSAQAQGAFGVLCVWNDPETFGVLTASGTDISQARFAAQEAREYA